MSLSQEKRAEILELLAAGKITAAEASELLTATPTAKVEEPPVPPAPIPIQEDSVPKSSNGKKPKWLHVRVNDLESGKSKVTVNVPLRMVKFGLNVGRRFAPELDGVDWDDLSRVMTEEEGVLVDVQDSEDGEHVQIYVD